MSRSRVLLLLFVLLLAALWYAWHETPRQQQLTREPSVANNRSVSSVDDRRDPVVASLDLSGGEKLTFKKPKRDLFRPLYQAPVVVKKPVPPKPKPIVVKPPPKPKPQPIVMPRTGDKPIPALNVLGFVQKGTSTIVFLSSRQGDLYLVKKGDRFADGLLVRELDGGEAVISRGQNDTGVTLKISEQKTVRMAIPNISSGRPSVPEYQSPEPKTATPAVQAGEN